MNRIALAAFFVPLCVTAVMLIKRDRHTADSPAPPNVVPSVPAPPLPTQLEKPNSDILGRAEILDGDTIRIGDARIRLFGIDAPEGRQSCSASDKSIFPCGTTATRALMRLVGNEQLRCRRLDIDRYGRIVAVCYLASTGADIGAWLVENGFAMAFRRYSKDYISLEEKARLLRRGLWQGDFTPPWEYRALRVQPPASQDSY